MADPKKPAPRIEKYKVRDNANPRWSSHQNNKLMTLVSKPLIGPDDTVFAIGSCFAERIRLAMDKQGLDVGPPMENIELDPDRFRIDALPGRAHMNYYNTYTIRQEFHRHVGTWKQEDDDYWIMKDTIWGGDYIYQDPYRRMIFGRTPEDLADAVSRVNEAVDEGIRNASVFFITLGMTEVFVNKKSKLVACQKPGYAGGGGEAETSFYASNYEQNLENLQYVVDVINQVRPGARVVVSVSPIALARTFGDHDILVANMEGKSILRAAVGALERANDNVTYFPSYEIVMNNAPDSFRDDDGRHVDEWIVTKIVDLFKEAHFVGSEEGDDNAIAV